MKYQEKDRKSFRENIRNMDRKQRLEYIWMYYKVRIIVCASLLFMAVSMGSAMVKNHQAMQKVQLAVLNAESEVAKELWPEETTVVAVSYLSADPQVLYALGARLYANELDVSLLTKDHVDWISAQDALVPLDDILELPGDEAEKIYDEETGQVLAVCVNDTPFYAVSDERNEYLDDLYLCVSARDERLPDAITFAQKVLDTIGTE